MIKLHLAAPGNLIARLLIGLRPTQDQRTGDRAGGGRPLFWPTVKQVFLLIIVLGLSLCSAIKAPIGDSGGDRLLPL